MKQLLLATALIVLSVAAFTGFNLIEASAGDSTTAPDTSLRDLPTLDSIAADVQTIASTGDLVAAKARIKDFEIAWDANEKGLKPKDPAH
jgi:hypothetical protein